MRKAAVVLMMEVPYAVRPGRRFAPTDERLLEGSLRSLAGRLPGAGHEVVVSPEVSGPRGIADLVAVTRGSSDLEARLESGLPFLTNVTDCLIVAAASPKKVRRPATLAGNLGMSLDQVQRRLSSLTSRGYLIRSGTGFARAEGLKPIGRSYAFEAKVSDWQQGISQALRYSSWCDAAALVLLRPPRDLTEVQARCRALGIGLGVMDRWLVRPRLGHPQAGLRLAASEQWAENLVRQSPSEAAYFSRTAKGASSHAALSESLTILGRAAISAS